MNGANEVDRVSPDGTYAKISVPGAYSFTSGNLSYGHIIYARGNLWMTASHGLVKVAPDGSRRRLYQLVATSYDVTLGPDGAIYATAQAGKSSMLYRIDTSGALTGTAALPVYLDDLVSNSGDGNLYAEYGDVATGTQGGIARVHLNLATDLIPGDPNIPPLASSNGSVYFQSYHYDSTLGMSIYELARLDRNGIVTQIPLPPPILGAPTLDGDLSVDRGGNLWMIISTYYGSVSSLYQYNVYTGHFSNPIQPDSHFFSFYGEHVTVGPDDNIWWAWPNLYAQALVVYVRSVQTLEPSSVSVSAGTSAQFTILETHSNGPWTARSVNPSVAVVSPALSKTGAFSVTRSGVGMTSIAVTDRLGNVSYELVAAN